MATPAIRSQAPVLRHGKEGKICLERREPEYARRPNSSVPNTTAIRNALERGEGLDFVQLGERGTSIRIK